MSGNRQMELMREIYFKQLQSPNPDLKNDKALVRLILDHAKKIISHPAKPTRKRVDSFLAEPFAELAIEETLEEDIFLESPENIRVEIREEKPFSCVVMLDTSSSMAGEKHFLASLAVAVLVLEVPALQHSLVIFASESKTIKPMESANRPEDTLLRFLKHQPRGFTNIALGLSQGVKELTKGTQGKRKVGLLVSDGRSTEGENPVDIAKQYDFLVVLHLCGAGSDLDSSKVIAQAGHGICLEVEQMQDLPKRLYQALRMLARQ